EFRDKVLRRSIVGNAFVSFYYRVSPPIAEFISQHEILRTIAREGLIKPIVHIVEHSRSLWSGKSG
ncbi:MAG: CFI-box-CTERM domain-containing protein, partial [Dehalococcoidia bacterium]|nr:CFI-box-CTERM domain-containing protein [Dehalococcoidia bacterium]